MEVELARLRALAAAVDLGSLEAAARALHLTPSAVSQRIQALEAQAGRVLLVRSRPVRPSEAGTELLRLARQIDALVEDAAGRLDGEGPARIAIAVNADSLATWVLPALAPLAGRTAFVFVRDDQEHTHEFLRSGEVMAAIGSEPRPVQGCSSTLLGSMRYRPYASPAFARRWFPEGAGERALAAAPIVEFNRKDALQRRFLAERAPGAAPPRHQVPGSVDFVEAVRLGYGWGFIPELQAETSDGGLVPIDGTTIEVPLHWQQWRIAPPALDRAARAVREAAAEVLHREG
ncbi:MAG: LysR family transcriptional regulator ArgP [Pseudoclavibacter sp.]|nr:LysR family transcriptional regulator ArgP [Pseudoclavibacter sp.]